MTEANARLESETALQGDDDFYRWEYEAGGRVALLWELDAKHLLAVADLVFARANAARILWSECFVWDPVERRWRAIERALSAEDQELLGQKEFISVALMLLGYSLEVSAKGIVIEREPSLVDADQFKVLTHDLILLMAKSGIELSDPERDSLIVLTEHVKWAGRYPIPTRAAATSIQGGWVRHRMGSLFDVWTATRPIANRFSL